ncbi:MAG TPA: long-chain fatty acid--CoA ligase, partial [Thermoanaerobaculia bacterium]
RLDVQQKQGHPPFGVEMKITDDANNELPRDGQKFGRLKVRGAAITRRYFKEDHDVLDEDGFFDTGDVATIDPLGYMQITDRAKDVIKSGGEWISSVEIENLLMGHPGVAEAAVIGVPDPTWDERPLACVVLREGAAKDAEALRGFLDGKVAGWWLPERWAFLSEIPRTSVGKFDKKVLRARYANGELDVVELDVAKR